MSVENFSNIIHIYNVASDYYFPSVQKERKQRLRHACKVNRFLQKQILAKKNRQRNFSARNSPWKWSQSVALITLPEVPAATTRDVTSGVSNHLGTLVLQGKTSEDGTVLSRRDTQLSTKHDFELCGGRDCHVYFGNDLQGLYSLCALIQSGTAALLLTSAL